MRWMRNGMSRARYESIGFVVLGAVFEIPNNVIKFDMNENKFPKHISFTGAGGSVGGGNIR